MSTVWSNGSFQCDDLFTVSAFDHPIFRGDGIFESTRTEGNQIYFLGRHLDRLAQSAQILEISIPDPRVLAAVCQEVVTTSGLTGDGALRITIFANGDQLITHRQSSPPGSAPRLAIYPEIQFSGSNLLTAKTLSYARSGAALRWATAHGADEVIFVDENGSAVETALANFVVESNGKFFTPPIRSGALRGITRQLALDWFPEISEKRLSIQDVENADGILIMSGVRFIRAAASINGRLLDHSEAAVKIARDFYFRARANPNS